MGLLQKTKKTVESRKANGSFSENGGILHEPSFESLLDLLPYPATYITTDYRYKYANKAYADWFEIKQEEVIGKQVRDFLGKKAFNAIKPYMDKAFSGTKVSYEEKIPFKQGVRFIEATYTPDLDASGKVRGYVALIIDITQKKEKEGSYLQLIQNLPAALYTTDAEGYITQYNEAAEKLWGKKPVIGKERWCGSWKIFEADGITEVPLNECPMGIALKEKRKVITKEPYILERPDGTRRYFIPYPELLFDVDGKMIGASNMLLDITDNKIAEEQSGRLAAIIHSSSDAIISKTLNGIITSWNESAERMFGYTADEMIGQPITKLIPADRLNEETLILEKLKRGQKVEHFETKRISKDKRILDVSLTISPIRDQYGNITGASKIARNITESKALYESLKESEERLRMASEATNLGTWEFHPITKKLIWSEESKNIYGVPADFEPDSEFVAAHMHPDDRQYVHEEVVKAMEPGNQHAFDILYRIFRGDDQSLRWIKVKGKVYFNEEAKAERFIGTMLDVTEEKKLEQLIVENEERFRMAIESAKLGTWEYNPATTILLCSKDSRQICGLPLDVDPDFQMLADHIYAEDKDLFYKQIKTAIDPAMDGKFDMQLRIYRYNDKEVRWVRAQGKVFFNEGNKPVRLIGTLLDITEEKLQELKLKSSVELFTTMAENVPAMIWMSGDDRFSDYFNKTWLTFTGRTLEQESNEKWLENVHPDDVQRCVEGYNKAFNEQKEHYIEYRLRRHDGVYRWIADNSVPRYTPEGKFTGFISACIDIDDQKNFREKIMESELKLKTISNASPVGLWMTDTNAQNIFVNETWIEWTGIPFEQQLGTGWLGAVVEEDKVDAPAKFWECLLKREKYSTEFRIIRPDGEMRWCLTEGYPYYDIEGVFAGYAGSVTDITDIRKMEERKDDFIKMASHELKTPITSIKGYVQLLLNIFNELNEDKFQSSKPIVRSSLQTISKQVTKLTRLVSELLDLSRIESGKLELHMTEFDLGDLIEETVQDVRYTTSRHAIIVHNDFEGKVYADKDRISQVLLNLLTNAIKYSPNADQVEVFAEKQGNEAIIKVKDEGIGIDKKDQDKIFQRFYRVEGKSEQTYPGFGIGLFIASEIVQRHEGTIAVESQKNKGSVFTVTLPIGLEKKTGK